MDKNISVLDKAIDFIERHYRLFFMLIIAAAIFNIFYKIGISSTEFDEARHGINAYEMLKNKELIVNTYAYKIDYWNLKPPLSFWIIILGYKIFGFNMVGLRMFSCLSALLTILAVGLFVKYKHGRLASLISAIILATSTQYILLHSARNAEADSLYVLLFTLSVLSVMLLDRGRKYLYLSALFASLAFLTKSWHAFPILCVVGGYIIISRTFLRLKLKEWLLLFCSFLLPILIWALLRMQKDGLSFFKNMVEYDLLARSSKSLEGHTGGIGYYFQYVYYYSELWIILLLLCLIAYVIIYSHNLKGCTSNYRLALFLWLAVPLGLYSAASTKIGWYILPEYPPIAVLCGGVFANALKKWNIKYLYKGMLAVAIVLGILFYEQDISRNLINLKDDKIELTLREMGQDRKYQGYSLYTAAGHFAKEGTWQQVHLLSAEIWCDFKTVNGGIEPFLNSASENTLLFIPEDETARNYI
ncbi:MAG: glycosyltransferase family 39 protein, partial [Bacillota bacterium]|nr:glycosyltransferase family 39 protein [Bacillota bacterium]